MRSSDYKPSQQKRFLALLIANKNHQDVVFLDLAPLLCLFMLAGWLLSSYAAARVFSLAVS